MLPHSTGLSEKPLCYALILMPLKWELYHEVRGRAQLHNFCMSSRGKATTIIIIHSISRKTSRQHQKGQNLIIKTKESKMHIHWMRLRKDNHTRWYKLTNYSNLNWRQMNTIGKPTNDRKEERTRKWKPKHVIIRRRPVHHPLMGFMTGILNSSSLNPLWYRNPLL